MVRIEDRSHVRIAASRSGTSSARRWLRHPRARRRLGIEIRDNVIHDMRGKNAMGITVYATKAQADLRLVIDATTIHDCEPARARPHA
jgi:hypothetical protein